MTIPQLILAAGVASLMLAPAHAGDGQVTFIHIGDLHGHLIPRPDMRHGSPSHGQMVGGLAHVHSRIKEIRKRHPDALLVNTGDTVQGSAEALYTSGQAMVDILNTWKIDAFAAGNWDFVYGTERFRELWAGENPKAPWGALAANLYYATLYDFPQTRYARWAGKRVLPPYAIKQVGNVKVGIIGLVADRPPQAVSTHVTDGFTLTPGIEELEALVPHLRRQEKADLVVVISERGLAGNLDLVERVLGVDVVLSSDMHEETWRVLKARTGTILLEEGQDGTMVGELTVTVAGGRMIGHKHRAHRITVRNDPPDADTAAMVSKVRESFVQGPGFHPHSNPMSGSVLRVPIDTIIGYTKKALHRSNYADAPEMPAVVEGSSHDFLADAFRAGCKSEVGVIRGFRYGTHIAPGPIRLEDVYHYIPIGPQIACGIVDGEQIRWQIEKSARGALTKWVDDWTGGWLYAWSGVTFDLDPAQEYGFMASNIRVNGEPLDPSREYHIAGYWYVDNAGMINRLPSERIRVLRDGDGGTVDATEVVAYYLQNLPTQTVDTEINRIRLLGKLPPPIGANKEIQPLKGVPRPDY